MRYRIDKCKKSQYKTVKRLIAPEYRECLKEKADVLAAYVTEGEEERPFGALLSIEEEGKYQILSLYVEEAFRQQGVARALLMEAEELAAERGTDRLHIVYRVTEAEAEYVHKLLFSEGYQLPRIRGRVFRITMKELEQTFFGRLPYEQGKSSDYITEFQALPTDVYRDYCMRVGKEIGEFLSLEQAIGRIIPEYCLAYHRKRRVKAFLIMTEAEGGLYLNSAYIQAKSDAPMLIRMLQQVWRRAMREKNYPYLSITAVNGESERLIEKLLAGGAYVRQTVYVSQKVVALTKDFPLPEGFGGVLNRTNALAEALADEGNTVEIEIEPGGMPKMRVFAPGRKEPVQVSYRSIDGEAYSCFLLRVHGMVNGEEKEAYLQEPQEFSPMVAVDFMKEFLLHAGNE